MSESRLIVTASRHCSTCHQTFPYPLKSGWTADEHDLWRCPKCSETVASRDVTDHR